VPALLDAAGVAQGSRVLDVCTGAGYAAGVAAERGAEATGVDFSAVQLALARRRYPAVTFQECDGDALPYPDETFDAVVNSLGMPHFTDPDAAIREAFRVLKREGRFAFTVYAHLQQAIGLGAVYAAVQAHGAMDIGLPPGPSYFLLSDPAESERRLVTAGFQAVAVTQVPQTWRVSSPDEVFDAVVHGSVRAAATLKGQSPEAFEAIRGAIRATISAYRRGEYYEVPMPAVPVSATKP
jgi:SAM-dependent methyltransferase